MLETMTCEKISTRWLSRWSLRSIADSRSNLPQDFINGPPSNMPFGNLGASWYLYTPRLSIHLTVQQSRMMQRAVTIPCQLRPISTRKMFSRTRKYLFSPIASNYHVRKYSRSCVNFSIKFLLTVLFNVSNVLFHTNLQKIFTHT